VGMVPWSLSCRTGPLRVGRSLRDLCLPSVGPPVGRELNSFATSGSVARLVLGQGGVLVLAGVTLGSLGSLLATRVLQSMLSGVTSDPSTLLVVVAGFLLAALFGCYLPARRASRIDPSDALRVE